MSRYVIFLDIDGVFTSKRAHLASNRIDDEMWIHFDPIAIQFMNRLDDQYDIDWVLMSTWVHGVDKFDDTARHWAVAAFRNAGFVGNFPNPNWKTEDPDKEAGFSFNDRALVVKKYLDAERLTYADFLIFDDTDYKFNDVLGIKRFIQTDPQEGLLSKHMFKALSLTGNWKSKYDV